MFEFPVRVRNILQWDDTGESYLFNPQSGLLLSTTNLFKDFLVVCENMDRAHLIQHLGAKYPLNEIHSLLTTLDQIGDQLALFETPANKDLFFFTKEMVEEGLVDTLSLTLTTGCNLRCNYCFGTLEYMQDTAYMNESTAFAAIDYLFSETTDKRQCQIIYTGGEPLLNWPVLKSTTEYAEAMARQENIEITFWIKTNGTLISDQILDFLELHRFNIQISIDGQQEDHDQARYNIHGTGSFETALDALQRMIERRNIQRIHIRATVTHQNVKNFKENLLFLTDLGADKVSAGPVMASEQSPFRLTEEDLTYYRQGLLDVITKLAANPYAPENQKLLKVLGFDGITGSQLNSEGRYGCGAGVWHLAIDVDGTILPCYRLAGHRLYEMGDVWEIDKPLIREVQKRVLPIYNRDHSARCRSCWGQIICRRGCMVPELLNRETENVQCDQTVHVLETLIQTAAKDPTVCSNLPRL